MSFLVKRMEMPLKCGLCPCFHADNPMCCQATPAEMGKRIVAPYEQPRPDWCPIVEVPTPHGRLIDADALMTDIRKNSETYFADDFAHEWVDRQPTIIPAEEG